MEMSIVIFTFSLTTPSQDSDEVWFVGFSHNGLLLGSASKDTTAIVWDISPATTPNSSSSTSGGVVPIRSLAGHKEAISFLAWSPCDKMLLTASNDKTLKLWMVQVKKKKEKI